MSKNIPTIMKTIPSASDGVGNAPKIATESSAPIKGAVENHAASRAAPRYRSANITQTRLAP